MQCTSILLPKQFSINVIDGVSSKDLWTDYLFNNYLHSPKNYPLSKDQTANIFNPTV